MPMHTSIRVNNDRCSVTPRFTSFERIILIYFPSVRPSILVRFYVCPKFACAFVLLPICLF